MSSLRSRTISHAVICLLLCVLLIGSSHYIAAINPTISNADRVSCTTILTRISTYRIDDKSAKLTSPDPNIDNSQQDLALYDDYQHYLQATYIAPGTSPTLRNKFHRYITSINNYRNYVLNQTPADTIEEAIAIQLELPKETTYAYRGLKDHCQR